MSHAESDGHWTERVARELNRLQKRNVSQMPTEISLAMPDVRHKSNTRSIESTEPSQRDVGGMHGGEDGFWKERVAKELNRTRAEDPTRSPTDMSFTALDVRQRNQPRGIAGTDQSQRFVQKLTPEMIKGGGCDGFWKARVVKELNRLQMDSVFTVPTEMSLTGLEAPQAAQACGLAGTPLSQRFGSERSVFEKTFSSVARQRSYEAGTSRRLQPLQQAPTPNRPARTRNHVGGRHTRARGQTRALDGQDASVSVDSPAIPSLHGGAKSSQRSILSRLKAFQA